MQVVIFAYTKITQVLRNAFQGPISTADKFAVRNAFVQADAAKVIVEADLQQSRPECFYSTRIGNAIVATIRGYTMVNQIVADMDESTHEVASVKEAAAMVRAIYHCDVDIHIAGPRRRLNHRRRCVEGRFIYCGEQKPFTPAQMNASDPMVAVLVSSTHEILGTVIK